MYKIIKKEKLPGSITEIQIEITSELVEKKWPEALKHIGEHVNLPGFRKGHIPEKTLISQIGEMTILEEAAEHAIEEVYPNILKKEDLHPIGSPKVVITKIARGNTLEVTLRISTLPEISLPEYVSLAKKISAKEEKIEITDKEVEDVVEEIKKYRAPEKKEGEEEKSIELTDDFVQTLGDFKNVSDFKEKVKENLSKEKEYKNKEKKRIEILESIREKTKIDVPEVLIESEIQRMINEFSHELSRIGSTFEKYLSQIKKTEDDVKNEWKEKAKKRVESELIIFEIAKKENLKASPSDIERELEHLKEHYKDAPKERLLAFVEDTLTKEEVFKFLENNK